MRKTKLALSAIFALSFIFPATALNIKVVSSAKIDKVSIYYPKMGNKVLLTKFGLNPKEVKEINIPQQIGMFMFEVNGVTSYCYFDNNKLSEVTIDKNNIASSRSSDINKRLSEWSQSSAPMRKLAVYFYLNEDRNAMYRKDSCFNEFAKLSKLADAIIDKSRKGDREVLDLLIRPDFEYMVMCYAHIPQISGSIVIPEELNKSIVVPNKLPNEKVLSIYPNAIDYMSQYMRFAKTGTVGCFGSDRVKAAHLINKARGFKQYSQYESMKKTYANLFVTDEEKRAIKAVDDALSNIATGAPAFNFAYPDAEGKIVKLEDFKGKLVYVDIWATWCGPCKSEIPHLEKLEEKMHGKNVVFVSISVDEDKAKWLNFVKNSKGVQINDSKNEITKRYNISGIPRFMLFDENGNIITTDAPRPSNKGAENLINQHLK